MKQCPTILEMYSFFKHGVGSSDTLLGHFNECEKCSDISAQVSSLLMAQPRADVLSEVTEDEADRVLLKPANEIVEGDLALVHSIFLSKTGREYLLELADFTLTEVSVPAGFEERCREMVEKITEG